MAINYRLSDIGKKSDRIQLPFPGFPFEVETLIGSATTAGATLARFAAQRSCIRADNFARVSGESFRFCRPEGADAAGCSAFPPIKALFGRGDVLEAARFTLRTNLERRLASFCMLASSFSSFRLKLFNVIIYNSSFRAMRGGKPRSTESNTSSGATVASR
jgi:hypothetical protein